ncbi:hypothetical protein ACOME3_000148 [Neoechinorhynchus agilis]
MLYWDKRKFAQFQFVVLIAYLSMSFTVCLVENHITRVFPRKMVFYGGKEMGKCMLTAICLTIPWINLLLFITGTSVSLLWILNMVIRQSLGSFTTILPFVSTIRMQLKGLASMEIEYRKRAFDLVTSKDDLVMIPVQAKELLELFVNSIQRQYSCCGWQSYKDYVHRTPPRSCCKSHISVAECANSIELLQLDSDAGSNKSTTMNTTGCQRVLMSWFQRGFALNLVLALCVLLISILHLAAFMFNRKANTNLLLTFGKWNGIREANPRKEKKNE